MDSYGVSFFFRQTAREEKERQKREREERKRENDIFDQAINLWDVEDGDMLYAR